MEPLVPDWRTLGVGPQAAPVPTTARTDPAQRSVVVTTRVVTWIVGALIAAALTGGAVFLALMPAGGGVAIDSAVNESRVPDSSVIAASGVDPGRVAAPLGDLVVDVEGAVVRPGLIHVAAGGRVGDALVRAGGFAANADLTRTASELNLAQQLSDGLKIVVPAIGQDPSTASEAGPASKPVAAGGAVDLNHATEAELDGLPGVGPATIAKIIAARAESPFASPEDLRTRDIVGDAVFGRLKDLVTAGR